MGITKMKNISKQEARGYDSLRSSEQMEKFRIILPWINPHKRVLDVGCGTGLLMQFLPDNAVGVDKSEEMLSVARSKYPDRKFVQASAGNLPFGNSEFGLVVSISAAHLFENKENAFSEMLRVGQDEFIISYPHSSAASLELERLIRKKFSILKIVKSRIDVLFLLRYRAHQHQT